MKKNLHSSNLKKMIIRKCFHNKFFTSLVYPFLLFTKGYNYLETKKAINEYCGETLKKNEYSKIYKDIIYCFLYYNIIAQEYFIYNFNTLNKKERIEFLSIIERDELIYSVTSQNIIDTLKDKYKTYEIFKPFYKRDAIKICNNDDKDEFINFIKNHKDIVIKPINGTWGIGVKIVKVSEIAPESFFEDLIKKGEWIIEEKISQVSFFRDFNSSSLNTIRILTIVKNNKCNFIFGVIRFGIEGVVTDNFSTGGNVASINIEKGIIQTPAYNKKIIKNKSQGNILNPNTNTSIIGLQIPNWNDRLFVVEECSKVLPEAICVGWDFALTEKGWCMIEANGLPSVELIQLTEHKGIRNDFISYFLNN